MTEARILIAGVGNIFFGDDGFGVEVVRRLGPRPGMEVVDFGIRGFDLACALLEPRDLVILVDASRRGEPPGTLYLMEVGDGFASPGELDGHGLAPAQVFDAVRSMGGSLRNVYVLACEPEDFGDPETGRMGLSASVTAAVDEALAMIEARVGRVVSHA